MLPAALARERDRVECVTLMGLLPEIDYAWMTVDDTLYLWNYRTQDFTNFRDFEQVGKGLPRARCPSLALSPFLVQTACSVASAPASLACTWPASTILRRGGPPEVPSLSSCVSFLGGPVKPCPWLEVGVLLTIGTFSGWAMTGLDFESTQFRCSSWSDSETCNCSTNPAAMVHPRTCRVSGATPRPGRFAADAARTTTSIMAEMR